MKGKRWVIFALSFHEDMYGVARMHVPYRPKVDYPDGLDCRSADDVFRLYWRYTEPKKMGYFSTNSRLLQSGGNHADKIVSEMAFRHCTDLLLVRGQKVPDWFIDGMEDYRLREIDVTHVQPSRSLPPGLDADRLTFLESTAWRTLYAYLQKKEWPKAQMGLRVFGEVGKGKDTNAREVERARPPAAARVPSKEELEQLESGELSVEQLLESGVRLTQQGKQKAWNMQEYAKLKGRGQWAK